jgi:hypothetical protein
MRRHCQRRLNSRETVLSEGSLKLPITPTLRDLIRLATGISLFMRFYPQNRVVSLLLLLTNLVAFGQQVLGTVRHPSTGNIVMLVCWGVTALLTFAGYWGTYWKLTPQGLLVSRLLLIRRVIPYSDIQDITPFPTRDNARSSRMKIAILSGEPVLASPDEYGLFVSGLEEHVEASKIHV